MSDGGNLIVNGGAHMSQQQTAQIRRTPLLMLLVVLAVQLLVYVETYGSMVQTWWRSETFAHGFLILPISLYLIWTRREQLQAIDDQPDYRGLPFIALCGFGWLLANLADVLVIQQLAVVAMIPVLIWSVCGLKKAWAMAFPLAFLLFAVPAGEFLVPSMMEFTADFTVYAVRQTGIPVFREGLYFTLPSGSWSVVEACSGVRYIIASLTLGCLYAYLTYYSYWRRALFILLALITPIIANGIRAYMIVMIGHLSSMKLAVGVDHLIYGWLWFGIVMFILFWVGSFWRDEKPAEAQIKAESDSTLDSKKPLWITLATTLLLLVWPLWAGSIGQIKAGDFVVPAPDANNWQSVAPWVTDWQPRYINPSQLITTAYQNNNKSVGLYLAHYAEQKQDAELINANNILLDSKESPWHLTQQDIKDINLEEGMSVVESQLKLGDKMLLVWQWNIINGTPTVNNYYAKLLESWGRLVGKGNAATGVVIYTSYVQEDLEGARQFLSGFVNDFLPQIKKNTVDGN
ncbi:MAG: exosortase A [Pseudomonadales bacterium]|nr:exosortase A [Pseudomonadales bacterium]